MWHETEIDLIPNKLKDLNCLEKNLKSKIAIIHGKGELPKIKGNMCNVLTELANIFNVLPIPADSNELRIVKIKGNPKYRYYV